MFPPICLGQNCNPISRHHLFGLGRDRDMNLDNADASGIYGAVDYIAKMKLGESMSPM